MSQWQTLAIYKGRLKVMSSISPPSSGPCVRGCLLTICAWLAWGGDFTFFSRPSVLGLRARDILICCLTMAGPWLAQLFCCSVFQLLYNCCWSSSFGVDDARAFLFIISSSAGTFYTLEQRTSRLEGFSGSGSLVALPPLDIGIL